MATTKASAGTRTRDTAAEVAFLTRALKAPTLRESVSRLAERARAESWSHEEFLIACLQREVSARESHGGEGRSAGKPSSARWCSTARSASAAAYGRSAENNRATSDAPLSL